MNHSDKKTWNKPSIQDLDSKYSEARKAVVQAGEGVVTTTGALMIMFQAAS